MAITREEDGSWLDVLVWRTRAEAEESALPGGSALEDEQPARFELWAVVQGG